MAYSFTFSNGFKYALSSKKINFETDEFDIFLMRDGYTFDPDDVRTFENVFTESLGIEVEAEADDDSFTRATGGTGPTADFETEGYIPGNMIWTDMPLNPGPFTIDTVSPTEIVVLEALVDEGPSSGITFYSDDELEQINGYITGLLQNVVVTENDTTDKADIEWDNISWTADGGDIGPTPGAIILDNTANFIVGYLDFDGDKTATDGNDFEITNIALHIS